jgi:hypothetical protein
MQLADMTFGTLFPCGATLDIVCPKRSTDRHDRASDNVKSGTAAARGTGYTLAVFSIDFEEVLDVP